MVKVPPPPPKKRMGRPKGIPKTPGSGRKKGQRSGTAISWAHTVLEAAKGVTKTKKYRAYARMLSLAEEIDRDLDLAKAAIAPGRAATDGEILTIWELRSHLANVLGKLLPYEMPRLTAVKISGDRNAPLFDLSGLSEKELNFIRDIILKSQQVQEESED